MQRLPAFWRAIPKIMRPLKILDDIGMGYLTLGQTSNTLSGGESQRIRLASQVGSGLQGVLYILDEPSIGLHQTDNRKLIQTLQRLPGQRETSWYFSRAEPTNRSMNGFCQGLR